jgi:hypothetical protein
MISWRGFFTVAFGCGACIMLTACFNHEPAPLPSDEVLRRTVLNSQTVDSVAYLGTAGFKIAGKYFSSGSLAVRGVLRNIDRSFSLQSDLNVMLGSDPAVPNSIIAVSLSSPSPGELFVRVDNANVRFQNPASFSGNILGKWWRLNSGSGSARSSGAIPDPGLMNVYSSAIKVMAGGLEKESGGRYVYHYQVDIAPETLLKFAPLTPYSSVPEARGEIWIDAETFRLDRAKWFLKQFPTQIGLATAAIDLNFNNYNRASAIIMPDESAPVMPVNTIFAIFYPS